jgi:hypothetical protein
MTEPADPRLTRVKPVKEKFSLNEKTDVPLYKQAGSYNNYKERIGVELTGVHHADEIIINKSDYTQRGEE